MLLFSTNHIMSSTCPALRSSGTQRVGCENGCSNNHAHNLFIVAGAPHRLLQQHLKSFCSVVNHFLKHEPFVECEPFLSNVNLCVKGTKFMNQFLIGSQNWFANVNLFFICEPFQKRFTNCVLRHQLLPADLCDFQEPFCLWSHFSQRVHNCGPFCQLIFLQPFCTGDQNL